MKRIELRTDFGKIIVNLDNSRAPQSVKYFCQGLKSGLYDDCHFYRVVKRHPQKGKLPTIDIIQGGLGWDICEDIDGPPLETTRVTGLSHQDGTISFARSKPDVSSPEFFICLGDQPKLDYAGTQGPGYDGFAAFGHVVKGMDVVHAIHQLPANSLPPGGDERFRNEFLDDAVKISASMIGPVSP